MSNPLSAAATGFAMVPYWPANQLAKTTLSPSTADTPEARAQTQFAQIQPVQTLPMRQRRITELPRELLVLIFDYLEFDDIRRVNATCLAFRGVVIECNYLQELSYFACLPRSFREQYRQNALWKKKSLDFHPFAKSAPLNGRRISFRDRVIKNLPQMPAILCLATLGEMESCPTYRMVRLCKVALPESEARYRGSYYGPAYDVCFSRSGGHLLFYGWCLSDSRLLAGDDQGQWVQEYLNWSDNSGSLIVTGANFSACTNRLSTCSTVGYVNTLQPAQRCWNDTSKIELSNQKVQFSPSGKYMATHSMHDPVIVWRMDKNNDWLKMEIYGHYSEMIDTVLFSPSEQHLALHGETEITMLSLNDHGAWSAQQAIALKSKSYARFNPVADQLLVGTCSHQSGAGRVSIYSPEPSGKWQETIIFPDYYLLEFSSTGKYLSNKYSSAGCDLQLWTKPEKLSDWSIDHFQLPHRDAASSAGLHSDIVLKHEPRVEYTQFSPSDSHLLVLCTTGTIYIWGKSQADQWSIQTITRECMPTYEPCFSLSGLHVLTYNSSMVGILGRSQQKDWSLKGVIRQDGILKAYFNPLSEHEVVVLSRTVHDNMTNIALTVWGIRNTDTPD